jgi:hypothetical protein
LAELNSNNITKIMLVAIVCSTLISSSTLAIVNGAISNPSTSQVITGDTQNYREFEGFAPQMEPWEAGMVTDPQPGTFEWWYFQGQFDDGSKMQITLSTKPYFDNNGPLQPYYVVSITTPNGTILGGPTQVNTDEFKSARNTLNLTMGKTWVRGDLNTVLAHVGFDLVFKSAAPPTRFGGSGKWFFDPSLTRYSATNDPMPFAKVEGNLTYGGQNHKVQGTGYFDKQWGNVNFNDEYDGWYWNTGHYGNYTIDSFVLYTSAKFNHQQTQDMYLAKGNGPSEVLLETMQNVNAYASGKNITAAPGKHTYPEVLTIQYKNGSNSATLTLTDPTIIASKSLAFNTNATLYGYPQYFRLGGNGTLNVQWDGTNETASAPAVWEVFYTH